MDLNLPQRPEAEIKTSMLGSSIINSMRSEAELVRLNAEVQSDVRIFVRSDTFSN